MTSTIEMSHLLLQKSSMGCSGFFG